MTGEIRKCFEIISEKSKSSLLSILKGKHKIVIASHKNPDGDAIGSALGLAGVLRNAGHQVDVLIPDSAPAFLNWLPAYKKVVVYDFQPDKVMSLVREADLLLILDLSHPDRMGDMQVILSEFSGLSLQIDHHPGSGGFTTVSAIDSGIGSTSELIYHFLDWIGFFPYLDADSATCLLTGIITDTLGFKVASSYPDVFSVVMKLMEAGADKDMAFDQIYNQYSEDRFRLLGFSLASRMKVFPEQGAAYLYLSQKDTAAFNHKKGDTEGFVNYPLSIKGIDLSVFFTEHEDHIKLSLRSTGKFNVNEIASIHFNGGGHHNAAGGKFYGTMDEALEFFESLIKTFI